MAEHIVALVSQIEQYLALSEKGGVLFDCDGHCVDCHGYFDSSAVVVLLEPIGYNALIAR
jgi:hypothetical protein